MKVKFVRAMFIQVLENLIDNSVYWMSVGKRRKVADEAPREIHIVLDGNRNIIKVSDTGPGIAPENRERVFRPFFTLKPAGHGKGLGLYIAREIAEYHGGTLKLTDKGLKTTGRLNTFELEFLVGEGVTCLRLFNNKALTRWPPGGSRSSTTCTQDLPSMR